MTKLRVGDQNAENERPSTRLFQWRPGFPELPSGVPSTMTLKMQALYAHAFDSSPTIPRKVKNAGVFVDRQIDQFGPPRIYANREDLWASLIGSLDLSRPITTVLEFGVVWGCSTQWWLQRLDNPDLVWHGFDRFTGLPRAWRGLQAGAFDAAGKVPQIADVRLCWQIGDVEETLTELPINDLRGVRRLVLFDLDIYEPTAMDADERRVLDELVIPSGAVEYIGSTASALALILTRPVPSVA